jgi:hypothetical protein
MSYDLMVFAVEAAPRDRAAFLEWSSSDGAEVWLPDGKGGLQLAHSA